jgi:hypothetical protein
MYYTKEDILKYVDDNLGKMKDKPLNPREEVAMKLENEEDVVGFFWIEYEDQKDGNVKPVMQGKMFVKIYHNIYTDDRYAIDSYHAQLEGVSVAEIIRRREEEKEIAKKLIDDEKNLSILNKKDVDNES